MSNYNISNLALFVFGRIVVIIGILEATRTFFQVPFPAVSDSSMYRCSYHGHGLSRSISDWIRERMERWRGGW